MEMIKRAAKRVSDAISQWGITPHVVVVNLLGIALVALVLILVSVNREETLASGGAERQLEDAYIGLVTAVERDADAAAALATTFAHNTAIQEAFAARDREKLIQLALPTWLAVDAEVDVSHCQFHIPPATSFLRLHDLDTYGDDLRAFRSSVVDTIAQKQSMGGLEAGISGISVRGVVPLWYGNDLVGSVEVGLAFDEDYLKVYSAPYAADIQVYLLSAEGFDSSVVVATDAQSGDAGFGLYASTLDEPPAVPLDAIASVLETDEATTCNFLSEGESYAAFAGPLHDYSGRMIGVVVTMVSRTEALQNARRGQLTAVAIGLGVMGLVGYFSYRRSGALVAPIGEVSRGAERVAAGNFSETIEVKSQNEIGRLATLFNVMVANLRQLMSQVRSASQHLSQSGERLAVETEELNSAVEQVSIAVGELAQGAGTQAVRVEEASHAMGELAEATGQISRNAAEVGDTSIQALRAVDDAQGVSRTLEGRAQRIAEIVISVDKVADQTNLLALNASIEAARAGEAGAGFAVVAQEVRRLAETSTQLVSEIAELSQAIEQDLDQVRGKMARAQQSVGQAATIAQEMAVAAHQQEASTDAMVTAMNEVAAVAEQSAVSSEQIAVTVEQQVASIEHIAAAAQKLAEVAGDLESSVTRLETQNS